MSKNKTIIIVIVLVIAFMLIGLFFLPKNEIKIEHKDKVLSISICYPIVKNKLIEKEIKSLVDKELVDFQAALPKVSPNPDWKYELDISYKTYQKQSIKSFVFAIFTFPGGAHPMTRTITKTFDLKTSKIVKLADLFDKKQILPLIIKELEKRELPDKKWLKKGATDLSKFALASRELIIYYDPYEVGPYSAGPQTVKLPLIHIKE